MGRRRLFRRPFRGARLVSHDLIHNQYFKSKRTNELVSYVTADLLIGLSRSWWREKHNVAHHSYTNSDIHDTDIRDYDEIFTKNAGKFKFFDRNKCVLFWFVTPLLYFSLLLSYRHVIANRTPGELLGILGNLALYPAFLVMNYGFSTAALAFCGTAALAGGATTKSPSSPRSAKSPSPSRRRGR